MSYVPDAFVVMYVAQGVASQKKLASCHKFIFTVNGRLVMLLDFLKRDRGVETQ